MPEHLNLENQVGEGYVDREKRSEVFLRFIHSAENIEPLHGRKMEDIFSSEKERREFIENLQDDEFIQLLDGVNGIMRNKKKDEWGMDGETVVLKGFAGVGYLPPRQEDKTELLAGVLTATKEMEKDGKDLKDIGLLVSSSLNAIHPYLDANGRTSRLLYLLLTTDYGEETKTELQGVLKEHGRDKLDIDPGLVQTEINDLLEEEIGARDSEVNKDNIKRLFGTKDDLRFDEDIPQEDQKLFGELLDSDNRYIFLSAFQYIQSQDDKEKYLQKFEGHAVVPVDLFSKNLTQEELKQILLNYRELKKKYVQTLIDVIAHPEEEKYKIDYEGSPTSLKDYFEFKMKEKTEKIAEEDRFEKEEKEAEEKEQARIEQKENLIKERFNHGEGEHKTFSAEEINGLQSALQELDHIIEAEKSFENKQHTEEEKSKMLKESLLDLTQRINADAGVSREQVDAYVADKQEELQEYFLQYHAGVELMKYLDNCGAFKYKINTSKDCEVPFVGMEHLKNQEQVTEFLDDLFSQSVYYVSESGASLRLKLFEVKSKNTEEMVQKLMERIFYSKRMVDYNEKKVVRVDSEEPSPQKYVFEITSTKFLSAIQTKAEQEVNGSAGIIKDEEGIYVDIPEGSILHSGWHVVNSKSLRE